MNAHALLPRLAIAVLVTRAVGCGGPQRVSVEPRFW